MRAAVLIVVGVLALVGVAWRLDVLDPYRAGTTHEATARVEPPECTDKGTIELGGDEWWAATNAWWPETWGPVVTGELAIHEGGTATFTGPDGQTLAFVEGDELRQLGCAIRNA